MRNGSAMRRLDQWRADHELRARARGWVTVGTVSAVLAVGLVGGRVATAGPVDIAVGGDEEVFVEPTAALAELAPVAAPTGTMPGSLPRRVVVVGDSQASALVKNAPKGLGSTLALTNGAVEGCGLVDDGSIRTAAAGFRRSFGNCQGWPEQWAASARQREGPGRAGRHRCVGRVRHRPGRRAAGLRLAPPRRLPHRPSCSAASTHWPPRAARWPCSRCRATSRWTGAASSPSPSGATSAAPPT